MYSHFIPNRRIENLERRQDARKKFNGSHPVVADCITEDCDFSASIQNVSSSGVFINTTEPLFVRQEIAMKINFPEAKNTIMANGEIVRTSYEGAGVKFKIIFKK
jgi:hypothetical protein